MRVLTGLCLIAWQLAAQQRTPVWIDTDPSVAAGGHEVDDGIALLQAFASPELEIRGISIVFGNTALPSATRIGREIVRRFGPPGARVYAGAAGKQDLGRPTEASRALAAELERSRLVILALGPVTNVATVVRNHPGLVQRIDRVIAVAGRRQGQSFLSGPSQKAPFRDLNFELDPESFRTLIGAGVPLVLTPWEISSKVWLTREELEAAAARNPGVRWMLPALYDWLALWKREFGADGFNPFDTLAVGYLARRNALECEEFSVAIEAAPDDTARARPAPEKPYLVVRPPAAGKPAVTYCHTASSEFKTDLLLRLNRGRN